MSDVIYRQDAIDAADKIIDRDTSGNNDVVKAMTAWKEFIKGLPSAEPERKKVKWLELTNTNHTYVCSICGRMLVNITDGKNTVTKNYPFCHCGADMRGDSDDN